MMCVLGQEVSATQAFIRLQIVVQTYKQAEKHEAHKVDSQPADG